MRHRRSWHREHIHLTRRNQGHRRCRRAVRSSERRACALGSLRSSSASAAGRTGRRSPGGSATPCPRRSRRCACSYARAVYDLAADLVHDWFGKKRECGQKTFDPLWYLTFFQLPHTIKERIATMLAERDFRRGRGKPSKERFPFFFFFFSDTRSRYPNGFSTLKSGIVFFFFHVAVRFLVGRLAAVIHGAGGIADEVTICPQVKDANLERLSRALSELPAPAQFSFDPCRRRRGGYRGNGGRAGNRDAESLGTLSFFTLSKAYFSAKKNGNYGPPAVPRVLEDIRRVSTARAFRSGVGVRAF